MHVASVVAGTAATLMPTPAEILTGNVSCELVAPGGSVMDAPLLQPLGADHAYVQPATPQSVPTAGTAAMIRFEPGETAENMAGLLTVSGLGADGLVT